MAERREGGGGGGLRAARKMGRRAACRPARRRDSPPSILSALLLRRATLENIYIPNCAPGVYRGASEVEKLGHLLQRLVDRLNPADAALVPLSSQETDVCSMCRAALVEEAKAVKRKLAALLRLKNGTRRGVP